LPLPKSLIALFYLHSDCCIIVSQSYGNTQQARAGTGWFIGAVRRIRFAQKRSYKNKKSFIDFSWQMQENEERRRLETRAACGKICRYFEKLPEDTQ